MNSEYLHKWDDDCVCTKCGFDGAEWSWWKNSTYEGRASDQKQPPCQPTYWRRK